MKKTKLVIVALFAALAVALVTGCQNTASGTNENSGTTQTNLVAGNTYKSTTAMMGQTEAGMNEGVNEQNYLTLTFAATGNTAILNGTGNTFSGFNSIQCTYTLSGTAITLTNTATTGEGAGMSMNGTVSSDGTTITFSAQNVSGMWMSATYVKQ